MARDEAYLQAEKKIEENWRIREKKLNLSKMKLSELPDSIGKCTHLEELDISNNQLTALPESLGQLTRLVSLNLSNNQLAELPERSGQFTQLQSLKLSYNQLTELSERIWQLTQLQSLDISYNQLSLIPDAIDRLTQLRSLFLAHNKLISVPQSIFSLKNLQTLLIYNNQLSTLPELLEQLAKFNTLDLSKNQLTSLPESIDLLVNLTNLVLSDNQLAQLPERSGNLTKLQVLQLDNNKLTDLPSSLINLTDFDKVVYRSFRHISTGNFFNSELIAAYAEGLNAFKSYLRAISEQVTLNEAKLILIGEGEVGKTSLLNALRGDTFIEGLSTTHGIEIKTVIVAHPDSDKRITLNGWDFGGQRVYRPTHQLFFSAPAVYLVVWKPREGPQQGFVKEWIKLVKHREPDAKILVVATHGGPQQRQPDIDRQELWDLFGKETVADFFFVDSKPDAYGDRKGIEELKLAIARIAAELPEVGRSVPKSFQDVRQILQAINTPYLSLDKILAICREHSMDDDLARIFVAISHRLGHLLYYEHDSALQDIVILKPDWLASAISFVLDDEVTRNNHGIISFDRLTNLWNDSKRKNEQQYVQELHPLFLRLMERFDLSYKVALLTEAPDATGLWQQIKNILNNKNREENAIVNIHYTSLIAQLVPDIRPNNMDSAWISSPSSGDLQQIQICRIVDDKGNTATAEGLFFQLIVRLHKYSLGRAAYADSVHWQRGLVLDDDYNGRALLEHKGNDVYITVRAPYPERFLAMLTEEVKYLVESFWEGLRCDVMVPCLNETPCIGLFEVRKLIENKKRGRPEQPCPVCNEWQNIDSLLLNAPAARPVLTGEALANQTVLDELSGLRQILIQQNEKAMGRFDNLDTSQKELLSKADASYNSLMQIFTDEAKEGPRLFSMRPVDFDFLEKPKQLVSQKFRILLWCEHSQLPLFILNKEGDHRGIYEMDLPYEWVIKAAPYLKALTATLSLILPVASSTTKLMMSDDQYKSIEKQLAFGKDVFDSMLKGSGKLTDWNDKSDAPDLPHGAMQRAEGALLRELHSFLKEKDPGFGGLVRVMNKRQEFMWVHERFAGEY